jgi:hypothetical protein
LLCASETDEGLAAGFSGSKTGADAVVNVQRDVALEFGVEVGA